ncbi:MAG: hypothetical protein WCR72_05550 [Bacteroidota bacterium]
MPKLLQILLIPILLIWELPQILLGLVVFVVMKNKRLVLNQEKEKRLFFLETQNTGVSLGWFVFWTKRGNRFSHLENDCRMHEYGHSRQSLWLGPTYLIVIGIPSLCLVAYSRWYRKKYGQSYKRYFNHFPENWADKLGGVIS